MVGPTKSVTTRVEYHEQRTTSQTRAHRPMVISQTIPAHYNRESPNLKKQLSISEMNEAIDDVKSFNKKQAVFDTLDSLVDNVNATAEVLKRGSVEPPEIHERVSKPQSWSVVDRPLPPRPHSAVVALEQQGVSESEVETDADQSLSELAEAESCLNTSLYARPASVTNTLPLASRIGGPIHTGQRTKYSVATASYSSSSKQQQQPQRVSYQSPPVQQQNFYQSVATPTPPTPPPHRPLAGAVRVLPESPSPSKQNLKPMFADAEGVGPWRSSRVYSTLDSRHSKTGSGDWSSDYQSESPYPTYDSRRGYASDRDQTPIRTPSPYRRPETAQSTTMSISRPRSPPPRICVYCDENIKGPCITALAPSSEYAQRYHPHHFICTYCLKALNLKGTYKEHQKKPYCHECFYRLYSGPGLILGL